MDILELNQEMIDGNPVCALCTISAGPSTVWLWMTLQVRKWDLKQEKIKKRTSLLFMAVSQFVHWWFRFISCWKQGVSRGCVLFVSRQSPVPVQIYEGGSGVGSGGVGWWFPLEGNEKTGVAEGQMGVPMTSLQQLPCQLLLEDMSLLSIYLQKHSSI